MLRGRSSMGRAKIAENFARSWWQLVNLTVSQSAALCRTNPTYLHRLLALTDDERLIVDEGEPVPPSPAELKRIVERAGVEPTWNTLTSLL